MVKASTVPHPTGRPTPISDLTHRPHPPSDLTRGVRGVADGLLAISWYWYYETILPSLHLGLQQALGETYHHACCPARVRRAAWHRLTREGRESHREALSEAERTFRALQELRLEMRMDADCDSPSSATAI